MATDLFVDTEMPFTEHLEELRKHLLRAVKWVVLTGILMTFVADKVVKILAEPVERQLKTWYSSRLEERADSLERRFSEMPDESRPRVEITGTIAPQQLARLNQGTDAAKTERGSSGNSGEPIPVVLNVEIGNLVRALSMPLAEINQPWHLRSLSAQEAFMIYFKAIIGASLIVSSPLVFREIYSFVAVGLYAHERRFVNLTLPFSVLLFLSGVAICFFLVFPAMLTFFLSANSWMDIQPEFRLSEWIEFAVLLMLIFGVMFQLPLLMLMLERVGIITHDQLASKRRMAIFVNCIVAATVTPGGDPNTMMLLALPMCLLFELGLFLMRYFQRKNPFAVDHPTFE